MARSRRPFATIRKWRARDQHTGIDKRDGVPSTYEHLDNRRVRQPHADVYRVETFVQFVAPTPFHRNRYYVPGDRLDRFFDGWDHHGESVIDIRPLTFDEAVAEIQAFRARTEERERNATELGR